MKERPILFSAPMVRAILDGTKSQTRRIVKLHNGHFVTGRGPGYTVECYMGENGPEYSPYGGASIQPLPQDQIERACPYGAVGDGLWVRETFADNAQAGIHDANSGVVYRATDPDWSTMEGWKWKPSIFLPRALSRIDLRVTSVRVERLQDISPRDALAEGVGHNGMGNPVIDYQNLWESINGKGSWELNPWVWVIGFKRTRP
jgi:hypothetical protein